MLSVFSLLLYTFVVQGKKLLARVPVCVCVCVCKLFTSELIVKSLCFGCCSWVVNNVACQPQLPEMGPMYSACVCVCVCAAVAFSHLTLTSH